MKELTISRTVSSSSIFKIETSEMFMSDPDFQSLSDPFGNSGMKITQNASSYRDVQCGFP